GYGESAAGREASRWTADGGMVGLGRLPGGSSGNTAHGVSADGSVVVGDSGSTAFRWDATFGMLSGRGILITQGLDPTGWRLDQATGISADGRTIVGVGLNPAGQQEAWIARIEAVTVPEPSSLTLFGIGALVGVAVLVRRRTNAHA